MAASAMSPSEGNQEAIASSSRDADLFGDGPDDASAYRELPSLLDVSDDEDDEEEDGEEFEEDEDCKDCEDREEDHDDEVSQHDSDIDIGDNDEDVPVPVDEGAEEWDEGRVGTEEEHEEYVGSIDDIKYADQFIKLLKAATLDDGHSRLDDDVLERLLNPPNTTLDIDDPDTRFSIRVYLLLAEASEDCYASMQRAVADRFGSSVSMLSYYEVWKLVGDLTGVFPIVYDMCERSCMAYSGPYAELDRCPYCDHPRWDPKKSRGATHVPYKVFSTFPIGPQLQALWRSLESAQAMQYRRIRTEQLLSELEIGQLPHLEEFDDLLCGNAYLRAVNEGHIEDDDVVLMLSADGAQLYKNKTSDF
ncbi:hypothetical protein GLOTRDRAFT_134382 [Gloeophyllum trabeum ATCC 11539]|uniref:Uncharacterized protein n=1 Tax=Gloeophyllum trabeum (strain ATCC 11539 / FP-39264 / Madison 617) TaxID=670483 RepID=S7R6J7_GLOTA|nr:uncharacterized protein GLOTRDRAFT_134382 [Gloeophyllum trabeum ATCC 11539]EPQ49980.1 hypothetical protein GLOTRDRAFT_134382 [Gloeophyllum trabeum ATCC 11539]